jgi:histidinol dehydrogenase
MITDFTNPERKKWLEITKRPELDLKKIKPLVKKIFKDVNKNGDKSLYKYTKEFDKIDIKSIKTKRKDLLNSENKVSKKLKLAIKSAKKNIEKFHEAQKVVFKKIETDEGVECWQEKKAIERVGLYIPGGTAPLFSTILMLAIPAKIAGCKEIIICTPPDKNGYIPNEILFTAKLCGVSKIYCIGGAQAIAAMTFGTESIPKVYKIFGPGNQYVTMAKQYSLNFNVSIDMPAGPSELLVVGDSSSNASFIASDLLSQAEHGIDSQVILVSTSKDLIKSVKNEILIQVKLLTRKNIIEKSLKNAKFIYFKSKKDASDFINEYAPEHYIISIENEDYFTSNIINAGSVFIGKYSPESAGDYASGTNHTLPTNGYSKQYSGVNVDSFTKTITFQKISKSGLSNLSETIQLMAQAENLEGHKKAVSIRFK